MRLVLCLQVHCTSLRITTEGRSEGRPYLGASFGSHEFHSTFLQEKLSQWDHDIMQLSKFTSSLPHATYSAMRCYLLSGAGQFRKILHN